MTIVRKLGARYLSDFKIDITLGTLIDATASATLPTSAPGQGSRQMDYTLTSGYFPTITGGYALSHFAIGVLVVRNDGTAKDAGDIHYNIYTNNSNIAGTTSPSLSANYYNSCYTDRFGSLVVGDRIEMSAYESGSGAATHIYSGMQVLPSRILPNGYREGETIIKNLVFSNLTNCPTFVNGTSPSVYSFNTSKLYPYVSGMDMVRTGIEANAVGCEIFRPATGEGLGRIYRPDAGGVSLDCSSSGFVSATSNPRYKQNIIPLTITGQLYDIT